MASSKKREKPTLDNAVVGFGGVEISTYTVAAGEGGGGHESSVKNVHLLNFGSVKENGKANGIKESYDFRVGGNEGSGGHVGSKHSGFMFLHSGSEEIFPALAVKVVIAVPDRSENGKAIVPGDGL